MRKFHRPSGSVRHTFFLNNTKGKKGLKSETAFGFQFSNTGHNSSSVQVLLFCLVGHGYMAKDTQYIIAHVGTTDITIFHFISPHVSLNGI